MSSQGPTRGDRDIKVERTNMSVFAVSFAGTIAYFLGAFILHSLSCISLIKGNYCLMKNEKVLEVKLVVLIPFLRRH